MKTKTKTKFTKAVSVKEAQKFLSQTLSDASRMQLEITWGFDEAQADPFHRGWTADKFLQCIEVLLNEN